MNVTGNLRIFRPLFFLPCLLFLLILMPGCRPADVKIEPIAKALTCNCATVVVAGVLQNRSANYFSTSKFVLKDASGEIEVRPWLPLEVAPYHPDAAEELQRRGEKWPPETMASYLDVPVILWGRIEEKVLVVEHAEHAK